MPDKGLFAPGRGCGPPDSNRGVLHASPRSPRLASHLPARRAFGSKMYKGMEIFGHPKNAPFKQTHHSVCWSILHMMVVESPSWLEEKDKRTRTSLSARQSLPEKKNCLTLTRGPADMHKALKTEISGEWIDLGLRPTAETRELGIEFIRSSSSGGCILV